jgi:DNA-binding winged helix-turn-helix (wHTH) protein/tetratricopeptide (TPR) repeat protein
MGLFPPKTKLAQFGLFAADLEQRVLTKAGLRVKLQDQPFQVLALLLEHPGEVVTREEIRQKLWSSDTFVEFDDGLNTAIKKIRTALGDSADNPRFIETVPRRGYRFLAPVTFPVVTVEPASPHRLAAAPSEFVIASREKSRVVIERTSSRSIGLWIGLAVAVVTIAGIGGYLYRERQSASRSQISEHSNVAVQLRPTVAVLGFRNLSGRPEAAWFSTAMAEMLSTELSAGRRLRLVAGENIARTKKELPFLADADTLAADTLQRLRTNLDADYVVLGSYTDLGRPGKGRIRLDLRMQDTRTGETIEEAVTGQEDEIFELVSEAGIHLRDRLGAGNLSTVQNATIRAALPANPNAARLYAEGLVKLRSYEHLAARDLLLEAVKLEPSHALAHSALSAAWKGIGYDGKAREEARSAWELSSGLERENQLWVEGLYRESAADWRRAIEVYRTLLEFFPDDVEYGLRLAETQSTGGKGQDALATIAHLRELPTPISDDPRIDLQEAYAGSQLSDFKRVQAASDNAARKSEQRGSRLLLAQAELFQSAAARNLQDLDGARTLDDEAQHIYESVGDRYGAARARIRMADVLWRRGEIAQSNAIAKECMQIFQALGNKKDYANSLNDIGGGLIQLGQLDKAKSVYEQALAVQKEIDNKVGVAQELNNIGIIQQDQGDITAALKSDGQARDAFSAVGDKSGMSSALNNMAVIYQSQGNLAQAEDVFRKSLDLRQEMANESDVAESLYNLAELLTLRGNVAEAQKDYDAALAIRIRRGEDGTVAESRLGNAKLLLATGNFRQAETLLRAAVAQFQKEHEAQEASARATLAEVLFDQGELQEAASESAKATALLNKDTDHEILLKTETIAAEVSSSNNPQNSIRQLEVIIRESEKSDLSVQKLEAMLVLAQVEIKSGHTVSGHAHLQRARKEAGEKGLQLIASRASLAEDRR